MNISLLDLIVGALLLWFLVKNIGGALKTAKTIILALLMLMLFAIISQSLLNFDFAKPAHETLQHSFMVNLSTNLIKWFYPVIENNAPKVNSYIKEKVLTATTKEINASHLTAEAINLPKINIPENIQPFNHK